MRPSSVFTGTALTFAAIFFAAQAASAQSLAAYNLYSAEYADGSTVDQPASSNDSSGAFTSLYADYGYGYSASAPNGILGAQAVAGENRPVATAMRGGFTPFSEADLDAGDTRPVQVTVWSDAIWETTVTNTTDTALDYTFIFHVYGPSLQTAFDSGIASVYLDIYSDRNDAHYHADAQLDAGVLTSDTAFGSWHYYESDNYYYADSFDASLSIGTIGAGESFTLVYGMGAYAFATDMDHNSFAYIGDPFGWQDGPKYRMISTAVPGDPTGGIPEPASWALLIAGFGLIGTAMRRRRLLEA